jgi:hypothetical protein
LLMAVGRPELFHRMLLPVRLASIFPFRRLSSSIETLREVLLRVLISYSALNVVGVTQNGQFALRAPRNTCMNIYDGNPYSKSPLEAPWRRL